MLLVVHNLPPTIKYAEIKQLLQSKCGLNEVILDNLISEGQTKRVTVGLADDEDAAIVVRKINGLYLGGVQLYVEDVRLKKESEQPFRSSGALLENPDNDYYDPYKNSEYQQNSFQPPQQQPYYEAPKPVPKQMFQNDMNSASAMGMMNYNMPLSNMFLMPTLPMAQTHFPGFGAQHQPAQPLLPLPDVRAQNQSSFGFNRERVESNDSRPRNWEEDQQQNDRGNRERPYRDDGRAMSPSRGRRPDDINNVDNYMRRPDRLSAPARRHSPSHSRWESREQQFNNRDEDGMRGPQRDRSNQQPRKFDRPNQQPRQFDRSNQQQGQFDRSNQQQGQFDRPNQKQRQFDRANQQQGQLNRSNQRPRQFDRSNQQQGQFDRSNQQQGQFDRPNQKQRQFDRANQQQGQFDRPNQKQRQFDRANQQQGQFDRSNQQGQFDRPNQKQRQFDRTNQQQGQFGQFEAPSLNFASQPLLEPPDAFRYRDASNVASEWGGGSMVTSRDVKPSRQSRPAERWRDEPNKPPKRFGSRWENEEPQPKRFAEAKENKKWRENKFSDFPNDSVPMGAPPRANAFMGNDKPLVKREPYGKPAPNASTAYEVPPQQRPSTFAPRPGFGNKFVEPKRKKPLRRGMSNMEHQMLKDETWRGQAAADVAREILNKLQYNAPNRELVLKHLKKSVKSRINMMLGDALNVPAPDILVQYLSKFPPSGDKDLFEAVLKTVDEMPQTDEVNANVAKATPAVAPAKAPKPGKQALTPAQLAAKLLASRPTSKPLGPDTVKTIPKYPNGDKTLYTKLRELERLELAGGDVYELPPELQKALDQEADTLCDLFMGECMEPSDDQEKVICEQISDVAADEFRKVIRLHATKRLLGIGTGLVVHIFCSGKTPNMRNFEQFLRKYGVISLKKTDTAVNMYIASCNTFENYDALVAVHEVFIGPTKLTIKPRIPTGQKASRKESNQKRKILKVRENRNDLSLLQMPVDNNESTSSVPVKDEKEMNAIQIKVESSQIKVENKQNDIPVKVENEQINNQTTNVATNDVVVVNVGTNDAVTENVGPNDVEAANVGAHDDLASDVDASDVVVIEDDQAEVNEDDYGSDYDIDENDLEDY